MQFEPVERQTATQQVVASIRDAVLSGRLEPGERIPAERSLASQFGVNRATVREALALLSALGLVRVRHGDGARVAPLDQASPQLIPHLLGVTGALDRRMLADLLDLRAVLLEWAARRAAARTDDAGSQRLVELAEQLAAEPAVPERQELDFQFFEQLVALTDNRIFAMLIGPIRASYALYRTRFSALFADGLFAPEHYAHIACAVQSREPEAAGQAMAAFSAGALALLGDPS